MTESDTKYIRLFNQFLEKGAMNSTYKAVFLRALADLGKYDKENLVGREWIGHSGDKLVLDLNFIAVRFAKYYWDMDVAFAMRHMPPRKYRGNPNRGIVIVSMIKDYVEQHTNLIQNPPTLSDMASKRMKDFRSNVVKKVLSKYVLNALLHDMDGLFTVFKKQFIMMDSDIVEFMKNHAVILKGALNYKIAKYLEMHNKEARYIAIKIDNEKAFMKRLTIIQKLER